MDSFKISRDVVIQSSESLLNALTEEGILWWRKQRMKAWRYPPPSTVLWDLTSHCNLACKHCVVDAGSIPTSVSDLTKEQCIKLIDDLAEFKIGEIVLSGGEPLMRPDFFEIINHIANSGLSMQLSTNATLITESVAQRIADLAANVQVSIDAATPQIHDEFRQSNGSWKKAINGIKYLVEYGSPVTLATTVVTLNVHQISELYNLASDLNVTTYRILPFVPYGRGRTAFDLEISPEQMREVTEYLRDMRETGPINVAPMEFEYTLSPPNETDTQSQSRIGCDGGVAYCTITSNGEVLPCNFFAGAETNNVKEHSFQWIWENSRFLNYFRSLVVSDIKGECQNCTWLPKCRGSCVAANFAHGDIFQSNVHCWQMS